MAGRGRSDTRPEPSHCNDMMAVYSAVPWGWLVKKMAVCWVDERVVVMAVHWGW